MPAPTRGSPRWHVRGDSNDHGMPAAQLGEDNERHDRPPDHLQRRVPGQRRQLRDQQHCPAKASSATVATLRPRSTTGEFQRHCRSRSTRGSIDRKAQAAAKMPESKLLGDVAVECVHSMAMTTHRIRLPIDMTNRNDHHHRMGLSTPPERPLLGGSASPSPGVQTPWHRDRNET
jgi:hypothetical protein